MYKRKELLNIRTSYQLSGPEGMSIQVLEKKLEDFVQQFEVVLSSKEDKIEEDGSEKDCLVLFHPEHEDDFFKVVIDFDAPTKLAVLSASIAGESASGVSRVAATQLLQGGKMALANVTGTPGSQGELEYYADLYNVINALIGASNV